MEFSTIEHAFVSGDIPILFDPGASQGESHVPPGPRATIGPADASRWQNQAHGNALLTRRQRYA